MFDFCNSVYNNVIKLATNVFIYSIDVYTYFEFWVRKAYFNLSTNGSMGNLCEETNNIVFIGKDDTIKSYKNVLEVMKPVELLNELEAYVKNIDTPYKLIFIENYVNNEHCRILCSSAMISKQDIDFILSPNIFNDFSVESPFMNINVNSLNSDKKLENINLKSPINYIFKHNELLSYDFLTYFTNNDFIDEEYEIEILDNNCNFTNITEHQYIVIGDNDFYILHK